MSPLIKKEIRLIFPAAIMAVVLALPAIMTRGDDPIPIYLLFVGMVTMALSSFGRETSLNTFSSLLAQPAERTKIWQAKLLVLFGAFMLVFLVWFFAERAARSGDADAATAVWYSGPFVAVATFTGGLWSTLLLRQLAGAFWITLLVPVVLASVTGGFLSYTFSDSDSAVYAGLALLLLAYSLGGFFLARRLFFHAQDIGWTGGMINLPALTLGSRAESGETARRHHPFLSLLSKEIKLQSASLACAAALFLFHAGVIAFRNVHHFVAESAGDILTSLVWMIWLVFPLFISCLAVAEERRLGVIETQLCLPASRRLQFTVKLVFTLLLGIFLGAVLPEFLESFGKNTVLSGSHYIPIYMLFLCGWLGVAGFFGSSLARHFLQAIGYSIATIVICSLTLSAFMNGRMFPFDHIPARAMLTTLIAGPVLVGTLLWLSWLNFKNFLEGWPMWRRNLVAYIAAIAFVAIVSPAVYNRAWEMFLPAEASHGAARMSLTASRASLQTSWDGLLARLPDGRVWFARYQTETSLWQKWADPYNYSFTIVAPHFVAGSNWLSVATGYRDFTLDNSGEVEVPPYGTGHNHLHIQGYRDVVAVRDDGSLWLSDPSPDGRWMGDQMHRFGTETNWLQAVCFHDAVLLLKADGSLWQWGPFYNNWTNQPNTWPTLHNYQPVPIGTDSDWAALHPESNLARKSDGSIWWYNFESKKRQFTTGPAKDVDPASFNATCILGQNRTYVDANGRIEANLPTLPNYRASRYVQTGYFQISSDTNWINSVVTWGRLCALKSDGSLWQWNTFDKLADSIKRLPSIPPYCLSRHSDWTALARSDWNNGQIITLAADGSLWAWPDANWYNYDTLIKPSNRPRCLGNIFVASD